MYIYIYNIYICNIIYILYIYMYIRNVHFSVESHFPLIIKMLVCPTLRFWRSAPSLCRSRSVVICRRWFRKSSICLSSKEEQEVNFYHSKSLACMSPTHTCDAAHMRCTRVVLISNRIYGCIFIIHT